MKLTKNDMARVVIQALYNLPHLPPVDDKRVVRMAGRNHVDIMISRHKTACKVLEGVKRA
jgi:hypothetical protein